MPKESPNLRSLATEPQFDNDGDEVGERRISYWFFHGSEASHFADFLASSHHLIETIKTRKSVWRFIETGMNFLVKGFVSTGMEQLLWHIIAIEAVFGDDSKSAVNSRLQNRLANSLGWTKEDRDAVKKRFQKLYEYRSNLVHGSTPSGNVDESHLAQARDLAREAVFWSIQFWAHALNFLPQELGPDVRKAVLLLIDRPSDEWGSLIPVLKTVPDKFAAFRVPGYKPDFERA
jgi:Apea-like HEPN